MARRREVIRRVVDMLKRSRRRTAIAGSVLMMLGAIGPAGAGTSAASDLPPLGDSPMYRVNVTANGIQPGPGPTGQPELAWQVNVSTREPVPILVNGLLIVGTTDGH